ncbi:MAG TPA: glucose-6-phosphate dehydrogenase [Flavisolibacter sp.]
MKSINQQPPVIVFIFGGSGDLAYRKLLPALYNLFLDKYIPDETAIVGIGRSEYNDTTYRAYIREGIEEHSRRKDGLEEQWKTFSKQVDYLKGDAGKARLYQQMAKLVKQKAKEWGAEPHLIFYMSVAPQLAPGIALKLHEAGLTADPARSRMVYEKPFGHDLKSARELNIQLGDLFEERQIYRIDHFLGKETVQNILALRFANALFEPLWNSNYIDHVQITAAEAIGIEGRGSYYEGAGAMRDMVQNHILQLMCMVAMEAPVSFAADEIRNKKLDVLKAIRCWSKEAVHQHAVRGQYSEGWNGGEKVISYRQEKGVAEKSGVETFAAVKFYVDNWRWRGVPFYVRTGKAMNTKTTLVVIQFKPAPQYAFPTEAGETWRANRLVISIQPQMDIRLRFQAKQPGPQMVLQPVDMVFNYTDAYGDKAPEAYETLLQDVIEANPTLFMRADQVERAWEVIQPILDAWQTRPPVDFPNYAPGSWGPEDAEALIAKDGRHWTTLPKEGSKQ